MSKPFLNEQHIQDNPQIALDLSLQELKANVAFLLQHHQELAIEDLEDMAGSIRKLYFRIRPTLVSTRYLSLKKAIRSFILT